MLISHQYNIQINKNILITYYNTGKIKKKLKMYLKNNIDKLKY